MHQGYVIKVEKLRPHPNADRLQLLEIFGTETCVGLNVAVGEIGIYFPADLQLSEEYCEYNNLCRKKDEAGNEIGGFLDPNKRNVRCIRLRGERSDGIFMPLTSLEYTGINISDLKPGDTIDIVNGHKVCAKYIPYTKPTGAMRQGNKTRKKKIPYAPLFAEHADTEQLVYHLDAFRPGDQIEVTLKIHGTSGRTAYLPVLKGYHDSAFCNFRNALRKLKYTILNQENRFEPEHDGTPIYDYNYVSGTRRTVLENYEGGFYGSNEFREQHSKVFEGKLHKGETVYYEICGFTDTGIPIMPVVNNKKTQSKEFIKQYGETTTFSYGCSPSGYDNNEWCDNEKFKELPQSDMYVYRMTLTTEEGYVIDYTPDYTRYRCEQMGVKCVPVFYKGYIPTGKNKIIDMETGEEHIETAGEWIHSLTEDFYDGPDPIGKTHVREGVVVRIINRPKFTAYKHKNFNFKCIEGIAKAEATVPDIEEAESIIEEN